jgi:hypothetical protein
LIIGEAFPGTATATVSPINTSSQAQSVTLWCAFISLQPRIATLVAFVSTDIEQEKASDSKTALSSHAAPIRSEDMQAFGGVLGK